jgi:hypothetical protein
MAWDCSATGIGIYFIIQNIDLKVLIESFLKIKINVKISPEWNRGVIRRLKIRKVKVTMYNRKNPLKTGFNVEFCEEENKIFFLQKQEN